MSTRRSRPSLELRAPAHSGSGWNFCIRCFRARPPPEQQFLIRLLMGELRQGALEAVMVDALAKASGIAVDPVRRAVMLAGDIAKVASALLTKGEPALAQYDVQLFRPLQPMLARIGRRCRRGAGGSGRGGARVQAGWRARASPSIRRRCCCVFARAERCHRGSSRGGGGRARTARQRFDSGWRGA